jgi:hypothetical protein
VQGSKLEAVVNHFNSSGLKIEDVHKKAFGRLGAVDGIGLTLEEGAVELYLFDTTVASQDLLESLNNAKENGVFRDPGFNRDVPVVMNENIMLFGLEVARYVHPEKDKMKEVFLSFK